MAAREGHTLTAASDVLLGELPFTPSWVVQMAGRCWARLSEQFEPHGATLHYGIVDVPEDARSLKRIMVKKSVFSKVIDGEGTEADVEELKQERLTTLLDVIQLGDLDLSVAR